MNNTDEHYMELAYKEAGIAFSLDEVPVGCVLVFEDNVVSTGHNKTNQTKNSLQHAERVAIEKLGSYTDLQKRNMKMYITIEPCVMCAHYLAFYGVGRVIYGARNSKFGGLGSVYESQNFGIASHCVFYEIKEGVLKNKCTEILERFFDTPNTHIKSI